MAGEATIESVVLSCQSWRPVLALMACTVPSRRPNTTIPSAMAGLEVFQRLLVAEYFQDPPRKAGPERSAEAPACLASIPKLGQSSAFAPAGSVRLASSTRQHAVTDCVADLVKALPVDMGLRPDPSAPQVESEARTVKIPVKRVAGRADHHIRRSGNRNVGSAKPASYFRSNT